MLGEGKSPGSGCGWTRFDALNCLDKNQLVSLLNDAFRVSLTSLASKGAIIVRGGVLKFTHVVDNDTVHDVHTCTVAFSPSVLINCGICL